METLLLSVPTLFNTKYVFPAQDENESVAQVYDVLKDIILLGICLCFLFCLDVLLSSLLFSKVNSETMTRYDG